MADKGRLPRRKGEAVLVAALAGGRSIRAAAAAAHVGERSVYRRMQNVAFRAEVGRIRHAMIDRAVAKLAALSVKAAQTLARLLTAESEGVRRSAAVAILDSLTKLRTAGELEERLERLERALEET